MAADAANDLDTLAGVKPFLRIASDDTTFDVQLASFITGLSFEFNRYCRREIKARDRTDYYDGTGSSKLFVHHYPINTITTLHADSDREYGDDALIASGDYILYKEIGLITLDGSVFGESPLEIKLVYNGGYTTIPADVLGAFRAQLKYLFNRWKDNEDGLSSKTMGDGSIQIVAEDFLKPVKRVLINHKRKGHTSVANYG